MKQKININIAFDPVYNDWALPLRIAKGESDFCIQFLFIRMAVWWEPEVTYDFTEDDFEYIYPEEEKENKQDENV